MAGTWPSCFDEHGQSTIEYTLIVSLVVILVISVFVALGPQITAQYQQTINDEAVAESQSSISSAIYGSAGS